MMSTEMTKELAEAIERDREETRKLQAEYEARETYRGFTIADLRKVSEAVFDKEDWKNPWSAAVHHSMVGAVLAAADFFHADEAVKLLGIEDFTGRVLMSGRGYQAW